MPAIDVNWIAVSTKAEVLSRMQTRKAVADTLGNCFCLGDVHLNEVDAGN